MTINVHNKWDKLQEYSMRLKDKQQKKHTFGSGGVVFDSSSLIENAKIRYTIRMSATTRNPAVTKYGSSVDQYKPFDNEVGWQTTRAYPMFQKIGPRSPGDSFGGSPGKQELNKV